MSTPLRQNITFPIGRLVWGSVSKGRDKDKAGKPLTTKAGAPRTEWSFGVAYEKRGTQAFWQTEWGATVYSVARSGFPTLFDQSTGQLLPGRKFSYKVVDGDSTAPNENGNIPANQEGYAGHWVVAFKSAFAPTVWDAAGTTQIDADAIKCGDYIRVAGSVDSNGDAQKPGVYINHALVAHAGVGTAIVSGPDAASVFGNAPASHVPAGMTAITAAPNPFNPAPPSALPMVPGVGAAAPVPPAAAAAPTPPAQTPVVPNPGFLNTGAPPPPPPPAPAGPVMTAKAAGVPYAAFIQQGWTEVTLRANGYIV